MKQRFEKDPYEVLRDARWSAMAIAGGSYELYVNGTKHTLGPIRVGPNWFHLGSIEMCVTGITEQDLTRGTQKP